MGTVADSSSSGAQEVTSEANAEGGSGFYDMVRRLQGNRQVRVLELALVVAGGVTLLWGLVQAVAGSDDFDLDVWVREVALLYPSDLTADHRLPLAYQDRPAESVTVMQLRLVNRGTETVGDQGDRFTIDIVAPQSGQLVLLDDLVALDTVADAVAGPEPNVVRLEVGLLPATAHVDLVVMAIDSDRPRLPALHIESSLEGLPPPEVTRDGPDRLIAFRLAAPLIILLAVALLIGHFYERQSDPDSFPALTPRRIAGLVAWWVGLSVVFGFLLALLLGWVLAMVARFVGG